MRIRLDGERREIRIIHLTGAVWLFAFYVFAQGIIHGCRGCKIRRRYLARRLYRHLVRLTAVCKYDCVCGRGVFYVQPYIVRLCNFKSYRIVLVVVFAL